MLLSFARAQFDCLRSRPPCSPRTQARHASCTLRRSRRQLIASKSTDDVDAVAPILLPAISSTEELDREGKWMADMVRCWLDEEWTALEIHEPLSKAAGQAYRKLRQQGQDNISDLVLELATELQQFESWWDTFTNEYEVSNKIVELLMVRQGCDLCCATPADLSAIQRYEGRLAAEATER